MTAIKIQELEFAWQPGHPVLKIDSFDVAAGEHVFLHGPSGSGKTTLLGILGGILDAGRGRVEVLGRDLKGLSRRDRDRFRGSHFGFIFQMFNLIPYLSVTENIMLPCKVSKARGSRVKGSLEAEAKRLATSLEIDAALSRPVTALSVGQQQRVAAARALMGAPEIIIADEPTSALDSDRREKFLSLLFAEARRSSATVLFVSHDRALESMFQRAVSLPSINRAASRRED